MSTTDSDRGRLVTPLRVRHRRDEVEFKIKCKVGFFFITCRENGKTVSTTDSDRERLVSPLRVRHQGDEVEFTLEGIVFPEKLFS